MLKRVDGRKEAIKPLNMQDLVPDCSEFRPVTGPTEESAEKGNGYEAGPVEEDSIAEAKGAS
eukprot:744067-Pelagomonas_calceolata.AAC.5